MCVYNERVGIIPVIVCQEFKQHYLGKHDVRSKLIALSDSI
jgi:hypothetical protein